MAVSSRPVVLLAPRGESGRPADVATEHNIRANNREPIPILIAMVAWSEVIWLIALRT